MIRDLFPHAERQVVFERDWLAPLRMGRCTSCMAHGVARKHATCYSVCMHVLIQELGLNSFLELQLCAFSTEFRGFPTEVIPSFPGQERVGGNIRHVT
jgi:hypothetical protein